MKFNQFAVFLISTQWIISGSGERVNGHERPTDCCFTVSNTRIPAVNIVNYSIQEPPLCSIKAVRFYTKKNKVICSDPNSDWAKTVIQKLSLTHEAHKKNLQCHTNSSQTTTETHTTSGKHTETSKSTTVQQTVTVINTSGPETSTSTTLTTIETYRTEYSQSTTTSGLKMDDRKTSTETTETDQQDPLSKVEEKQVTSLATSVTMLSKVDDTYKNTNNYFCLK
ncbi:C-C motif chemokine 2-like [Danio aesculapii]|uniref:C-C motif chemokine 2-like n=1 Tax=Danio aesculapii TaxID=1142201 RepID=UPI0024BF63E4|nr:C-C motif chemokine 2-like [Danio aesculapii]